MPHRPSLLAAALVVAVLVFGGARPQRAAAHSLTAADGWVRTRDGWERESALHPHRGTYEPALHPAVLASLVTLASLLALVAFPAAESKSGS